MRRRRIRRGRRGRARKRRRRKRKRKTRREARRRRAIRKRSVERRRRAIRRRRKRGGGGGGGRGRRARERRRRRTRREARRRRAIWKRGVKRRRRRIHERLVGVVSGINSYPLLIRDILGQWDEHRAALLPLNRAFNLSIRSRSIREIARDFFGAPVAFWIARSAARSLETSRMRERVCVLVLFVQLLPADRWRPLNAAVDRADDGGDKRARARVPRAPPPPVPFSSPPPPFGCGTDASRVCKSSLLFGKLISFEPLRHTLYRQARLRVCTRAQVEERAIALRNLWSRQWEKCHESERYRRFTFARKILTWMIKRILKPRREATLYLSRAH